MALRRLLQEEDDEDDEEDEEDEEAAVVAAAGATEVEEVAATPAGATELATGTTAELAATGATLAADDDEPEVEEPVEDDALEVVPSAETVTFSAAVPVVWCDQHLFYLSFQQGCSETNLLW